jgi:putative tryptophan/tyrosine transport system substrate-binding protein
MKRRAFLAVLGGAATWPLAARAQHAAMPVIGFLSSESPTLSTERLRAFHEGLGETGYVEGRNVAIEYRWAEGRYDRLLGMVAAPSCGGDCCARRKCFGAGGQDRDGDHSHRLPFGGQSGSGWTCRQPEPTGRQSYRCDSMGVELAPKRLELLHELVPKTASIALLVNPANRSTEIQVRNIQAAGRALGRELHVLHASNEHEIDAAFATLVRVQAGALIIAAESFFNSRSVQLATLTVRHAVPAVYTYRDFAAAGGLISYGANITDMYRQAGIYAGRILKGEKPADMPVQQSATVELIINLRTAKALGLTVPLSLLGRADEVIE